MFPEHFLVLAGVSLLIWVVSSLSSSVPACISPDIPVVESIFFSFHYFCSPAQLLFHSLSTSWLHFAACLEKLLQICPHVLQKQPSRLKTTFPGPIQRS